LHNNYSPEILLFATEITARAESLSSSMVEPRIVMTNFNILKLLSASATVKGTVRGILMQLQRFGYRPTRTCIS